MPSLVELAARAACRDGADIVLELEEVADVPDSLMLALHVHLEFEALVECVLRGARSTWRLLETPAWFDAIFAHRMQAYVAARDAHREEMRSDFMTACELDGSEFYPLLHSAFQFRALVVDEDATDADVAALVGDDWAAAGKVSFGQRGRDGLGSDGGEQSGHQSPIDAASWYDTQFRRELQSLLWLARSVHVRCRPQPANTRKDRKRDRDCICQSPPEDWTERLLPCKLGVARLFGGSGQSLLQALGRPELQGHSGAGAGSLPSLASLTALDLSGLGSCVAEAELGARLQACPNLSLLDLSGTLVTNAVLAAVGTLSRLQQLVLCGCRKFDEEGLGALLEAHAEHGPPTDPLCPPGVEGPQEGKVSGLRLLNLRNCEQITDKGLRGLGQFCTRLEALSISGCPRVTDRGLMCVVRWTGPLARFNRLRRLCYTGCYRATGNVQRFLLNEL